MPMCFSNEWQEASYAIYDAFPKLELFAPYHLFPFFELIIANVYWDISNRLKKYPVVNPDASLKNV
jgi:hypothetical protein